MKRVKVAGVSPLAVYGEDEWENAFRAVDYVDEAAAEGAHLVCFPEGFPGPCSGPMDSGGKLDSTPIEMLCEKAKEHGVFISAGNLEESKEVEGAFYLCNKLISPNGDILANYRRCQPTHPILNGYFYGGRMHILPGDELMVADTDLGKIGLLICSELWVPELSRIEMLEGAEIILAPIGGIHSKTAMLRYDREGNIAGNGHEMSTWHCIARARAAENLVYVVTTTNVFFKTSPRGSFVAGPENTLGSSLGAGIAFCTLDMERLWYLRSKYFEEEDLVPPKDLRTHQPLLCRPGQNHDRIPALYKKLIEPQPDAFDYFYFKRGLEAWKQEYEKVKKLSPWRQED
ncbi:MAG: carbon-nitrogen hydrolase family protein [Pseudomonadota bacterium]